MFIYSGVCRIYTPRHSVHLRYTFISVQPPSLLEDVLDRACLRGTWRRRSSELRDSLGRRDWGYALGDWDRVKSEMHLEAVIERVRICTWRLRLSEFGDALGGHDRANLQAVIERLWRYTWRPWLSEFVDAHGGRDWASLAICTWRPWTCELAGRNRACLEIHLEAVIERVCRCTWRPWSSQFCDALPCCDRASLERHLQAIIERDWMSTCRQSIWREGETGWARDTVDLGLMLYLVYAVLGVNS